MSGEVMAMLRGSLGMPEISARSRDLMRELVASLHADGFDSASVYAYEGEVEGVHVFWTTGFGGGGGAHYNANLVPDGDGWKDRWSDG